MAPIFLKKIKNYLLLQLNPPNPYDIINDVKRRKPPLLQEAASSPNGDPLSGELPWQPKLLIYMCDLLAVVIFRFLSGSHVTSTTSFTFVGQNKN